MDGGTNTSAIGWRPSMDIALPQTVDAPLLLHGDCLEMMRRLPDGCINLIATDPPYFRVKGEAWDRQWDDAAGFLAWLGEIADEWGRILAPNGSLYCFASPQMSARVEGVIAERFSVIGSLVWLKELDRGKHAASCKEVLRTYFPNTERIVFAEQQGVDLMAMGESGYEAQCAALRGVVFEPLRAYLAAERDKAGWTTRRVAEAFQDRTGSRTVTGMAGHWFDSATTWQLPTEHNYHWLRGLFGVHHLRREYADLRLEYEALRIRYDEACRAQEHLRRPFGVTADVPYTDVWTFPTVQAYDGKHPCEKPREMMDHIIAASSRPGDLVLDCFLGSGVSGEAAVSLGRRFIGVEMGDYIHAARRRIYEAIGTPAATAQANTLAPVGAQLGLL
jgi:adenine-specific DNA-methyltransferase